MMKQKNPYELKKLKDGSFKFIIRAKDMRGLEQNWFIAGFLFVMSNLLLQKVNALTKGLKK